MNHLSKKELIEKIEEFERERNQLLSLYLTANSLIRDSNNYIASLWSDKVDLQEEIIILRESKKIKLFVQDEFVNIKAELRQLEENEKGENPDNWRKEF